MENSNTTTLFYFGLNVYHFTTRLDVTRLVTHAAASVRPILVRGGRDGKKRKIESPDWGGFEVDNGTKNVIDRMTKIRIKVVIGIGIRRDQN
ncbi:hypothetical protein EVAR_5618_1 [Eumeta japonica]|uniref:Uncharacterized protein n=1 Tax=Eumeta variegata TaxID=151549 RepID=A0A4C1TA46_EUMVA|nr:hypothetical protein EVAR_5618_1 [Eumeta japonica]